MARARHPRRPAVRTAPTRRPTQLLALLEMMVGGMIKGMCASMPWLGRPLALVLVALGSFLVAPRLSAQRVDSLTIRIRVTDTAGDPVAGAQVSVVQGLNDLRASGATNDLGRSTLILPRPSESIEVVARKIGFARGGVFLTPTADTATAAVILHPVVQTLASVKVTAREDI